MIVTLDDTPQEVKHPIMTRIKFLLFLLLTLLFVACVPSRKYEEANSKYASTLSELETQRDRAVKAEAALNEENAAMEDLKKRNNRLASDTTILGASLRQMTGQYDKINQLNNELLDKYNRLLTGDQSENRKLLTALESLRLDQQNNQDSLARLSRELTERSLALQEREARLMELEAELAKKDKAMADLKSRVSNALRGFEGKGLTIEERDGKLYVSLDNKLLFPSGSATVDSKGKKALTELAKAIEGEQKLGILVEGHTDTDAILPGSTYTDNWDLSVARAVSVVRILQDNSAVDPSTITAAGRGEYVPIDPADKAKNRRIEVILAPDLSELFEIVK